MAKKIVRGITDVKTINNQDFDTNNVNDLLSDGQYNYIHRKKGENEEYHNLTDNIKTISSDNTELLSVTNNNKTTNTATLHPKHDAQKEQVLESTRDTIAINHGTNGTAEKTTVDTNPKKVLEHENLISNSQYVTIEHDEHSNTSEIKTDKLVTKLDELDNKIPKKVGGVNLFKGSRNFSGTGWIGSTGEYAEDYQDVKIFKKQDMWGGCSQYFKVKTGEEYVFSTYVKSSAKTDRLTFHLFHADKQPQAQGLVGIESADTLPPLRLDLVDEYQRIAIKIKITKDGWIAPRVERFNGDAYLFFGGHKLERGNVATDYSPNPADVNALLAKKQDKLTAGDGITIEGQTVDTNPQKVLEHDNLLTIDGISKVTEGNSTTIGLKIIDNYSGDLNELTETCLVEAIHDAANRPVLYNGILTVVKIGDDVSQKYHSETNEVYTRYGVYFQGECLWSPWSGCGGGEPGGGNPGS